MLTELKNRGVADIFFLVCDGLKGLPDSVSAVFPDTVVQTCIIHLIRGTFRYAGRQHHTAIARALKPIYTAGQRCCGRRSLRCLRHRMGTPLPSGNSIVAQRLE
ncbi:transposase, Mutator family protein [Mycobacterium ulcerans str. Harvey]|uniref:Mutator family transposase n=1 Tax=Mycobacterium ulcerans str. Harvey TaxID=1299332 RepID=A0ABN0QL96_MYCUL|nr:transposase, Mutator family protein [Mycobacterium ulcerans str. Harvey]